MKTTLFVLALIATVYFGGCNYKNVDDIKAHAEKTFADAGYKIVGYEGYTIGNAFQTPGGNVWYIVKRNDSPTIYHGFLSKWKGEYHIYNLRAMNAIQGN